MNFDSAKESMDKMLKFCERPTSRVRYRFGDGDWQESPGPEFLALLKANTSGHVSIDHVFEIVHGEDGT